MSEEINEKMEQIRLKNEELEKKHKEILQDELEAKKQGATVSKSQAKSFKSNDRQHRYDNVDLDYDVKDEEKDHAKNPDYKPKNRRPILGKKQLDEIPPDPVNFLRDDFDKSTKSTNRNHNRNQRDTERSSENRQRNQNYRPKTHQPAGDDESSTKDNSNSPRKVHPQQLRQQRNERQHSTTSSESPNKDEQRPKRQNSDNNRPRPRQTREKVGNDITVEVTDEIRSVKLKSSEKTFGTGRVRAATENYDNTDVANEKELPEANKRPNRPHHNSRSHNNRRPKPKAPPQPEYQHPILDKIVISKTSVQDRLLRSKMIDEKDQEPNIETESTAVAEN